MYATPIGEIKYVDGYYPDDDVHNVNGQDNSWADTEANPRQQTTPYGCMPVPQQGVRLADRDGRKIFVKSIKIRGALKWPATNTLTAATGMGAVRLVLVKDKRTNGASLAGENVLGPGIGSDGQATLLSGASLMALTQPNGWGRYEILHDELYEQPIFTTFNDGTDGARTAYDLPFKISLRPNCEQEFSAATGTIGAVLDNSFHLLAACQGNETPQIGYVCRVGFIG